jgi:hypothetical protein
MAAKGTCRGRSAKQGPTSGVTQRLWIEKPFPGEAPHRHAPQKAAATPSVLVATGLGAEDQKLPRWAEDRLVAEVAAVSEQGLGRELLTGLDRPGATEDLGDLAQEGAKAGPALCAAIFHSTSALRVLSAAKALVAVGRKQRVAGSPCAEYTRRHPPVLRNGSSKPSMYRGFFFVSSPDPWADNAPARQGASSPEARRPTAGEIRALLRSSGRTTSRTP